MQTMLNIFVNAKTAAAQARLRGLQAQVTGLNSQTALANRQAPMGRRHLASLTKFGNQLQWTGRMLQYNFTLPFIAATGFALKWALEQEKAMTHVTKVYGDVEESTASFRKMMKSGQAEMKTLNDEYRRLAAAQGETVRDLPKDAEGLKKAFEDMTESIKTEEINSLDRAFTALSNQFGVQKKEVLEVAGAWAAAGQSGIALAKSTEATMTATIIGDMKSAEATKALISVQAQYNLSSEELMSTLAALNSVENATGASMQDLIVAYEKSAGVARAAGVPTETLAGHIAALVPASGSAATAGNALKTMYSRLLAPTGDTVDILRALGIELESTAWNSSTADERLMILARTFQGLSKSQQAAASSTIASRWQVSRFSIIMQELTNETGYYAKAMEAANDPAANMLKLQSELNTVLDSSPRRLQRMGVMIQNTMADTIQPLIPFILWVAQSVADVSKKIGELEPHVQKLVLVGFAMLALVGPVVRYFGALLTLTRVLASAVMFAVAPFAILAGALKAVVFAPFVVSTIIASKALGLFGLNLSIFGVILAKWKIASLAIFRSFGVAAAASLIATSIGMVKIWLTAFAGMRAAAAGAFAYKIGMLLAFRAKFLILWTGMQLTGMTSWAAFWATLKGLTMIGLMTQSTLFRKAYFLVLIVKSMSLGILGVWGLTWTALKGLTAAGFASIRIMWLVNAALGVSIWSRMGQAMVALTALTGQAIVVIWKGMGAAMIALSRVMWSGIAAVFMRGAAVILAGMVKVAALLFSPWGLAVAAIVGLVYLFRDQIVQVWNNITGSTSGLAGGFKAVGDQIQAVFQKLPDGVYNSMMAVVTIVRTAALAVYEWFSYINPFARHSPSLVENVTNGMAVIDKQFSSLKNIRKYTQAAYNEINKFGKATANIGVNVKVEQRKEDRAAIKKAGGGGDALQSYDKLLGMLAKLEPALARYEKRMKAQEAVVEKARSKVDRANKALDAQQEILDKLNDKLNKWQNLLQDAENRLQNYASAPLKGMREMEDQIFANSMAQTKLRYEIMKMEDTFGTYDEMKSKLDAIAGAEELLRGKQADLRSAGAGSDILSQYDDELKKLGEQRTSYGETAKKMNDMEVQLKALQREAEKLDLVKAMKFDELQYEIEKAADRTKEMSFEEIIGGIQTAQQDIDKYGAKVEAASAKVKAQEEVVKKATDARNKAQEQLDAEQTKLDSIKKKYDEINDAVRAIETSIGDVVTASEKLNDAADKKKKAGKDGAISPALQNFNRAGAGAWDDPGGSGIPKRDNWMSEAGDIDKYTEDMARRTAEAMDMVNPFKPLKAKAIQFWEWTKTKASEIAKGIGEFFGGAFDGVKMPSGASSFFGQLKGMGGGITEGIKQAAEVIKWMVDLLWPEIKKIGKAIWDGLVSVWEQVGPEVMPLVKSLGGLLKSLLPVVGVVVAAVLGVVKVVLSVIGRIIGPILEMIGGVLKGALKILRGVADIIAGIFTLDGPKIWNGIKTVLSGLWTTIVALFKGAGKTLWGVVKGVVEGVVGFFTWLWDILVGHSIVPDTINAIFDWFGKLGTLAKWVWDNVLKPVVKFFGNLLTGIIGVAAKIWPAIQLAWAGLKTAAVWVWNNILLSIWNGFKALWEQYILPGLMLWWAGIQVAWAVLKTVAVWLWNNVLLPIWNVVKGLWDNYVGPGLAAWWAGIQVAWELLKTAAVWMWDNVLEPIWDKFKEVWDKWIGPALAKWWSNVKANWETLKTAGKWVWDHILKPVWDKFKEVWDKWIGPALAKWWSNVKANWETLKAAGKWIWDNVLKPVYDKAKALWDDYVKPELSKWWSRIKTVWNGMTGAATWIWDNVFKPVYDKVKDCFNKIKTWLTDNKDMLLKPMSNVVDGVRKGVNLIIKGLNKVSDLLPGMEWKIDLIPALAQGGEMGRKGNRGFKTNGARAIVGEGKANYPEFVIPTDPTYRNRAIGLLGMAASKLGIGGQGGDASGLAGAFRGKSDLLKNPTSQGVPQYAVGGWLMNKAKDLGGKVKDKFADLAKDAVSSLLNPAVKAARSAVNKATSYKPIKIPPLWGLDKIQTWGDDTNKQTNGQRDISSGGPGVAEALKWARTQAGKPYQWGGAGNPSWDCSGFMGAIANKVQGKPAGRIGTTATFPWPGFKQGQAPGRGFTIGSTPNWGGTGVGHMSGTLGGVNVESRGGDGVLVGGSARAWNNPGYTQAYHLARGGIVKARRGGVLANIGEGNYDEVVQPLPKDWRSKGVHGGDSGGNEYHFHGDLSFPNITNPDDAQAFLDNLEALAKD